MKRRPAALLLALALVALVALLASHLARARGGIEPCGPGPEGPTGPIGPIGPVGPVGPNGSNGSEGPYVKCSNEPTGAAGPEGRTGPTGPELHARPDGPHGPHGPHGPRASCARLTRGALAPYEQVGILACPGADGPVALYGRPTHRGADRWNYYAISNQTLPQKLPIFAKNRDCAKLQGCPEAADGDVLDVRGYGASTVTLYTLDDPDRYAC